MAGIVRRPGAPVEEPIECEREPPREEERLAGPPIPGFQDRSSNCFWIGKTRKFWRRPGGITVDPTFLERFAEGLLDECFDDTTAVPEFEMPDGSFRMAVRALMNRGGVWYLFLFSPDPSEGPYFYYEGTCKPRDQEVECATHAAHDILEEMQGQA